LANGDDGERLLAIPLGVHGDQEFPRDVDIEPSPDRYIGFYENQHGEQLIFVREKGGQPMLYHGDYGWGPLPAEWPRRRRPADTSLAPWTSGELVLNQGEVLWLASCLGASGSIEEAGLGEGPLDRLLVQEIKGAFQREGEEFDRKSALADDALDRWRQSQPSAPPFEEDHYAEGAILVALGLNSKQRKPRRGLTGEIRKRIEREAAEVIREIQD
jgi:hypothetical protein